MTDTIEARLARLEAAEDIRRLKGLYCDLCDDGYLADRLARLFTQDAVWDGGPLGRYEGRDAIRQFFEQMPATLAMAIHYVTNPQITVADHARSAKGRWRLWQTATTAQGGALWFAGRYEDDYVRVGDAWLFESVTVKAQFMAPYETGWGTPPGAGQ